MYLGGFFLIMMFGVPGAALAMYHTAKSHWKKIAASLLMAAAFASFFTGVTETLKFSFMFLAPALYVVHAVLTGLSMFTKAFFQWTSGFGFIAGLVDYILYFTNPPTNKPFMLIIHGIVFFIIYYILFRFLIVKFSLKTPGREDVDESEETSESNEEAPEKVSDIKGKDKNVVMAEQIFNGLGGDENIISVDNCTTRLRIE